MANVICLVGCTASGKDSILEAVVQGLGEKVKKVISHTSRPKREHEEEGREYYFKTVEEITEMLNHDMFVETRQYHVTGQETWVYGITKEELDLDKEVTYIVIVDGHGLDKIKSYVKNKDNGSKVWSIFVDCESQTRLKRALDRDTMTDDKVSEICRRNLDDMEFVLPYKKECDFGLRNHTYKDKINNIDFIKYLIEAISYKTI